MENFVIACGVGVWMECAIKESEILFQSVFASPLKWIKDSASPPEAQILNLMMRRWQTDSSQDRRHSDSHERKELEYRKRSHPLVWAKNLYPCVAFWMVIVIWRYRWQGVGKRGGVSDKECPQLSTNLPVPQRDGVLYEIGSSRNGQIVEMSCRTKTDLWLNRCFEEFLAK